MDVGEGRGDRFLTARSRRQSRDAVETAGARGEAHGKREGDMLAEYVFT